MEPRLAPQKRDRLGDHRCCNVGAADLRSEQAKIMMAFGVLGVDREHLAIMALGLGEPAGLMAGDRMGEQGHRRRAKRRRRAIASQFLLGPSQFPVHATSAAAAWKTVRLSTGTSPPIQACAPIRL